MLKNISDFIPSRFVVCASFIKIALLVFSFTSNAETVKLAEDGKALATIILPDRLPSNIKNASKLLSKYIKLSSGAELKSVRARNAANVKTPVKIYLGVKSYSKKHGVDLSKLGPEGFIIKFIDANNIIIDGQRSICVWFGALDFLERYVGIEWLMPYDEGEYIPEKTSLSVEKRDFSDKPAYITRLLSMGSKTPRVNTINKWQRKMRMSRNILFHHKLYQLFDAKKYAKTHPEFYPIIGGKRYIPKPGERIHWQPCFSAKGSAELIAKEIIAYMKKRPEARYHSLGVTDGGFHCQCKKCMAVDGKKNNHLGIPHRTDSYILWCNKVAEIVTRVYPDAILGFLAYSNIAEVPSDNIKLHKALVPVITSDRMKWLRADFKAQDLKIDKEWQNVSCSRGWYDYLYGADYIIPRVYFHQMAKFIRLGVKKNVKHFYAETYPEHTWSEGPKLYLTMKLLWNPNLDVDATLNRWYDLAVGKKAAVYLKEYFTFLEDFWCKRTPKTEWFKSAGTFLDYGSRAYLDQMSIKELKYCESLLNKTLKAAQTPKQKSRAKIFISEFKKNLPHIIAYKKNKKVKDINLKGKKIKLVHNFTFDNDVQRFNHWQRGKVSAKFQHDKNVGHDKKGALNLQADAHFSVGCFLRGFRVKEGEVYRISIWIKAENVNPKTIVTMDIKWRQTVWSNKPSWLDRTYDFNGKAYNVKKGGWQKFETLVKVPPTGNLLMFMLNCKNNKQGDIWFDDMKLEKVTSK